MDPNSLLEPVQYILLLQTAAACILIFIKYSLKYFLEFISQGSFITVSSKTMGVIWTDRMQIEFGNVSDYDTL